MNSHLAHTRAAPNIAGFKLTEMMIALGVGALVLTVVMTLYLFGLRSFGAIGNYTSMDAKSRQALDHVLQEIRQASLVVGFQTNSNPHWLAVADTKAGTTNTFTWDSAARTFTWDKTGQPTQTLLTGCDNWSFGFYLRAPTTNGVFVPTTTTYRTKLINMSWSCSRTNIIQKANTESMVTAEVVLRNLQE